MGIGVIPQVVPFGPDSLNDFRVHFNVFSHAKESCRHTASVQDFQHFHGNFWMRAIIKRQIHGRLTIDPLRPRPHQL